MSSYDHRRDGAQAAYEEMSCLLAAGATGTELDLIAGRLAMALGDNAAMPEDLARAEGYRQMTAWVAEQLYREGAEKEAGFDAEPGLYHEVVAETLITTVIRETVVGEPGRISGWPAVSEPGPGPYTRALAATYERYAAELAEIEALRSRQYNA